jgi:quercetin dioxygenase-like cupin family protein
MSKVSKDSAAVHMDHGPVEEWSDEFDGQNISILSFKVDTDTTPLLKGLPGDRCTAPHWGYVLKGRVTYTFDDGEETHEAGDAFYVRGGHGQRAEAGTEYVQFSPAAELRVVSETIMRNLEMMQAASQ